MSAASGRRGANSGVSKASVLDAIAEGDWILLDTTVLAAFFDANDSTHPVAAFILKDLVATGRNPAIVSMVTIMEVLVRPMRSVPAGHHTVLGFPRSYPNLVCVPVDL